MRSTLLISGFVAMAAYAMPCSAGETILHVNAEAEEGGDGLSWETALRHLQDALLLVSDVAPAQIWVAQGGYFPDRSEINPALINDRTASFNIPGDVAVYGGFVGGETSLEERDWIKNQTVLIGDIGEPIDSSDNSFTVVRMWSNNSRLDGFTVRDGRADIGSDHRGAGISIMADVVIENCAIRDNVAVGVPGKVSALGAGIYIGGGNPLINLSFVEFNSVLDGMGGGIYVEEASPEIANTNFNANEAAGEGGVGGGLFVESEALVHFCIFVGNVSSSFGGGVSNFGSIDVRYCSFESNQASSGGGLWSFALEGISSRLLNCRMLGNSGGADGGAAGGAPNASGGAVAGSGFEIINTTIFNNDAESSQGNAIFAIDSNAFMANSIVWGNGGNAIDGTPFTIVFSNLETEASGSNISADPDFVNADAGNLQLNAGSPCIDAGSNGEYPDGVFPLIDLAGNPRIVDGTGDQLEIIDMGAYEAAVAQGPLAATWIAAVDGELLDPANWVDGIVPDLGDDIVFGQMPSDQLFTVTMPNTSAAAGSVFVVNQRPTFDLFFSDGPFQVFDSLEIGLAGEPAELGVTGGTVEVSGAIAVGSDTSAGVLTVDNGAEVAFFGSSFEVGRSGTVRGLGAVSSWESDFVNRGTIAPGMLDNPTGELTINGSFVQPSAGTLRIDLGSGGHDRLTNNGFASLGGTLVVSLEDGYVPDVEDSFEILTTWLLDPNNSAFQSHYLPALPSGLVMTVQYVTFGGPPAGDIGGETSVLLNIGTLEELIGFSDPDTHGAGDGLPAGLEIMDMNGNGRQDIVVLLRSSSPASAGFVVVLLNQGNGTSFSAVQLIAGLDPRDLVVTDLDGSGSPDIAVVNAESGNVMVWLNDGNAGFSTPNVLPVGGSPVGITAGDFRGVGARDLAVITADPNAIVEIQNDGSANFNVLDPVPLEEEPAFIEAEDMNLDGWVDVVVVDAAGDVMIFHSTGGDGGVAGLGGGAIPLQPGQTTQTGRTPTAMRVEDTDNSKDGDIIVVSGEPIGGGTGPIDGGPAGTIAPPTGLVSVFRNDGTGFVTDALSVEVDGIPGSLTLWDINGNTAKDIAVIVNHPDTGRVIRIFRNDLDQMTGNLVFSLESESYGEGLDPVYVRHGDMNNDGKNDMVALNASGAIGGTAGGEPPASIAIWANETGDPADPNESCNGYCGASAPAGCWCDSSCAMLDDCCDDFCEHCGAGDSLACPLPGGEGCGIGFWKQQHHWGHWAGYHVGELFCDIFDCATTAAQNAYGGKTLADVLDLNARGLNGLGRQAVAALLNASSHVSYDLYVSEVIDLVNETIGSGDPKQINTVMGQLDALNNQGCPISGHAPADMNNDGTVNVFDMLLLLQSWGSVGPGDFNEDMTVDVFDLLFTLSEWGPVH